MTSRSLNPHEPAYTKAARKVDRKAAKVQNRIARRALRRASLASLSLERHLEPWRDIQDLLLKTVTHKAYKVAQSTPLKRGFPFDAFHSLTADFDSLHVRTAAKPRNNRPEVKHRKTGSYSLHTARKNKFVKEIDGSQSEIEFENLGKFCSLEAACIRSKKVRGYKNFLWFSCGTCVVITRLQIYSRVEEIHGPAGGRAGGRPVIKCHIDTQ